jgi:hypothetical protein
VLNSGGGTTQGRSTDIPVPADHDGAGKADIAVYRNTSGQWFLRNSGGGSTMMGMGARRALAISQSWATMMATARPNIAVYRREWRVAHPQGE